MFDCNHNYIFNVALCFKKIHFYLSWIICLHTVIQYQLLLSNTNKNQAIGLMSRVFANGPGDRGSIPGWVIPKTQNGTWCHLSLWYRSRVKWSNSGNGVAPSPTPWCSSYWKGSLWVTLDYVHQLYLLKWFEVFLSNVNDLQTIIWFQVTK